MLLSLSGFGQLTVAHGRSRSLTVFTDWDPQKVKILNIWGPFRGHCGSQMWARIGYPLEAAAGLLAGEFLAFPARPGPVGGYRNGCIWGAKASSETHQKLIHFGPD